MSLEAIKYKRGSLSVLDQLLLPYETSYRSVGGTSDGHDVIVSMRVRGAPAIAIVAALSLAVELHHIYEDEKLSTNDAVVQFIQTKLEFLKTSRPTAVNLFEASDRLLSIIKSESNLSGSELSQK